KKKSGRGWLEKHRQRVRPDTTRNVIRDTPLDRDRDTTSIASILFRIEEFGEAGIFLEKCKIFVVAGVIAIGSAEIDGNFQIREGGVGFTGEAIERSEGVHDVIGFGSEFARAIQTLASVIPAAEIHHGDTALIMLVGSTRILLLRRLHALFGDANVHARAVRKFLAGALDDFFEFLLGALEFLLMKETESFVIDLHLRLNPRVD